LELDVRKMRILQAIIDDYILTAAPVGSRAVSKRDDIGLSPATIRNEMSDLEEMGYLEQPHTSAGRIPSDKAYRLYVNSIMHKARLTSDEIGFIQSHYARRADEVDEVIKQTARVLAGVTRYTSMVLSPRLHSVKLKYIHIVPVGECKALVIIVTDAGITRDSVIWIPPGVQQEALERISKLMTKRFENHRLEDITLSKLPEFAYEIVENKEFFDEMLRSLQRSMDAGGRSIELCGTTNILNYPEYSDMGKARNLLSAIESRDMLYRMLMDATDVEFSIKIGAENAEESIRDCSVVTATYSVGDSAIGSFGVIGPTRMNYSKVLALMGFIGQSMRDVLTSMMEEER